MANPTNKVIRQSKAKQVEDPSNVQNLIYNRASGGQKNLPVGPFLKPLLKADQTFTTDASTAIAIKPGSVLAIFNKSTSTAYSITLGDDNTVAAQAIGAVDANGNVGVACKPNDWSYVSMFTKRWAITNNNNLVVYLIEDDSYIIDESISK